MPKSLAGRAVTQERAVKTRRHILSSAIRLFGRRGILATTMSELARAIRMSPGALYWHFPTKEDLLLAAIEEMHQRFMASFEPMFRSMSGWSSKKRLQRFLEHACAYMEEHRDEALFFGMVGAEAAENNERVAAAIRRALSVYVDTLERLLLHGQRTTKDFRGDIDVRVVASTAIFCHFGVVLQQNLFRRTMDYPPLGQALSTLILSGVSR